MDHDYTSFDPAKRVMVAWEDFKIWVMDRFVTNAKLFHQHFSDLKRGKVVHEGDQWMKEEKRNSEPSLLRRGLSGCARDGT